MIEYFSNYTKIYLSGMYVAVTKWPNINNKKLIKGYALKLLCKEVSAILDSL